MNVGMDYPTSSQKRKRRDASADKGRETTKKSEEVIEAGAQNPRYIPNARKTRIPKNWKRKNLGE